MIRTWLAMALGLMVGPALKGGPQAWAAPPGEGRVEHMGKTRTVEGVNLYTVGIWQQNRESLWTIAGKLYGDPWQWKKIFQANQEKVQDPRTLYPKQELVIP